MKTLAIYTLSTLCFINFATAQTETAATQTANGPQITFDKEAYDFGTLKNGNRAEHIFYYTNTGGEVLSLSNVEVKDECGGCTNVNWSKEPVYPGNSGAMIISYPTSKNGNAEPKIVVTTNSGVKELSMKVNIVPSERQAESSPSRDL